MVKQYIAFEITASVWIVQIDAGIPLNSPND